MAIVKLISDFDGVWTNQNTEADYVWNFIITSIATLIGDTPKHINSLLVECKKEMDSAPYEYGWFNNGTISTYYQEDPFGDNNAIFDYIFELYYIHENPVTAGFVSDCWHWLYSSAMDYHTDKKGLLNIIILDGF